MDSTVQENTVGLCYNTQLEKLRMPEYGRSIMKMIEQLKDIPDKSRRTQQAYAVVKSMEMLNPQVHAQEDWAHKLWDHLHILAGCDLDIDSPYPVPEPSIMETHPVPIPLRTKPLKATHYGRNIESIIDLIASREDGETKTAMIKSLAVYMRQQYLIWNKDNVSDETIFKDIEKLSDHRIKVPGDLSLSKLSTDVVFTRPGASQGGQKQGQGHKRRSGNWRNRKK